MKCCWISCIILFKKQQNYKPEEDKIVPCFFRKEGFFMFSKQLVTAVLLACFASMFPIYAAEAEKATVADTQGAVPAPVSKTNAHSAVTKTGLMPAPAFTTIITAEEMEDNHYETVAEALTYAPGVTVTPGSVNTAHQVVRIDSDDRVAVFIDGRRQNLESGFSDGRATYDLDLMPPVMAIERIEILHQHHFEKRKRPYFQVRSSPGPI